MFDGKQPNWYHFNCFFTKQRPRTVADVGNFDSIRWEDQKKIKTKLGNFKQNYLFMYLLSFKKKIVVQFTIIF